MEVRTQNLTMHFRDADRVIEVFNNLNLTIGSGKSAAVVGESGVGKTTLLHILGGLESPVSGDVYIGETCVTELTRTGRDLAPFRGEHIGFIFQFFHLLPEFDAAENVAIPLLIKGIAYKEARQKALQLLSRVGLKDRITHRPGMLSGGEQQRVAVARALISKPGVILADEPTGNLDYKTGKEIAKLLIELQQEEQITLIVVTHSADVASLMNQTIELTPEGCKMNL